MPRPNPRIKRPKAPLLTLTETIKRKLKKAVKPIKSPKAAPGNKNAQKLMDQVES